MSEMSKAIREQLQTNGPTLKEIPTPILGEYITILSAYRMDMIEEYERRDR